MSRQDVTAYLTEARTIYEQVIKPMQDECATLRKRCREACTELKVAVESSTNKYEELQSKVVDFCESEEITLDGDYRIKERTTKGTRLAPSDLRDRLRDTGRYTDEQIDEIIAFSNLRVGSQKRKKLVVV